MSIPNPFGGPPLQPVPPGEDLNEFAISEVLKGLETEVDKHGWDQLHMIWAITRDAVPVGDGMDGLGFGMGIAMVIPGHLDPPWGFIYWIADEGKVGDLVAELQVDPVHIQAWVLVTEAWMVLGPVDSEAARKRELHKHPDRIEVRRVTAVDRAERVYSLSRVRGKEETHLDVTDPSGPVRGNVPEALLALIRATPSA